MDLDVAAQLTRAGVDLKAGVQEIGSRLQIPFAGVENRDPFARGKPERGRPVTAVEPDALQMPLAPVETGTVRRISLPAGMGGVISQERLIRPGGIEGREKVPVSRMRPKVCLLVR